MGEALSRVSQVKRVPVELARKYGLYGDGEDDILAALEHGDEGSVDIPCWRHAVINFPHPLLQQGLVILDTPGLNAIGTEPELTLNLLPNAHALLFILAADAGVTKTDLEVWNQHLAGDDPATKSGRIVILNKIDGLWDDLKSDEDDRPRDRPPGAHDSAHMLGIPRRPGVRDVCAEGAAREGQRRRRAPRAKPPAGARGVAVAAPHSGEARHRRRGVAERGALAGGQASARSSMRVSRASASSSPSCAALRGKNQDVVGHMMERVRNEKEIFERGLARFTALRNVFTQQTNDLFDHIGLEALRANAGRTRRHIEDSPFTRGVRNAMNDFFRDIHGDFAAAARQSTEIHDMMRAMYARFAKEHGLEAFNPPPFSVLKYQKESRAPRACLQHALQHAVEHGEQGEVRADEALLRDHRLAREARVRRSPTATRRRGSRP